MLKDIDIAARKSGACYTLGGGTCLGAVRHKGFIPWDDDLDLNMVHEDFPAFQNELQKLFPGKYCVEVPGQTPGYDLAFPRVRLNGTVVRTRDDVEKDAKNCGAYIDIFYIENAPSNSLLRGFHGLISMGLGFCYSCRRFASHSQQYSALFEGDSSATKVFKQKKCLGKLFSFKSPESWTRTWDSWNSICGDDSSSYITIPVGRKHYFGETYRRDFFFPVEEMTFEGLILPVPSKAASYMATLYGPDFMQQPPEEEREVHVVYEFDLGKYASC